MEGLVDTDISLQRATSNIRQMNSALVLSAGTKMPLRTRQVQTPQLEQELCQESSTWSTHIAGHAGHSLALLCESSSAALTRVLCAAQATTTPVPLP